MEIGLPVISVHEAGVVYLTRQTHFLNNLIPPKVHNIRGVQSTSGISGKKSVFIGYDGQLCSVEVYIHGLLCSYCVVGILTLQ